MNIINSLLFTTIVSIIIYFFIILLALINYYCNFFNFIYPTEFRLFILTVQFYIERHSCSGNTITFRWYLLLFFSITTRISFQYVRKLIIWCLSHIELNYKIILQRQCFSVSASDWSRRHCFLGVYGNEMVALCKERKNRI